MPTSRVTRHQWISILLLITIGGSLFQLLWDVISRQASMAYPDPYPPGVNGGGNINPTPTEIPPTSTSTPILAGTPWPSPTANPYPTSIAPRQGIAPAMTSNQNAFIHDRVNFASWQYYWGAFGKPSCCIIQISGLQHIPMIWMGKETPTLPPPGTATPKPYPTFLSTAPPTPTPSAHTPTPGGSPTPTFVPDPFATLDAQTDMQALPHDYWLIFNECESDVQCSATPQQAAYFYYHYVVNILLVKDPNAKLIVGGVNAMPCGLQWLANFVQEYKIISGGQPLPRAGWHFHIYPDIVPQEYPEGCGTNHVSHWKTNPELIDASDAIAHLESIRAFVWTYGSPEDEIWITEMGCLVFAQCSISARGPNFMFEYVSQITAWLNSRGRWIDRYAWYTDWTPGSLRCLNIDLTPTPSYNGGSKWTSIYSLTSTPTPAYNPCEITPTPNYEKWTPAYSSLGNYYKQIEPSELIPIPWKTDTIFFSFLKK